MANPLFYRNVVPLNRDAHRALRLKTPDKPYDFARAAHLIPALIDEFDAANAEMPVAFLPGAPQPAAVFVTGIKPGRNVFISAEGRWNGGYVPAYIRRYPYIIGEVANADPVLCIDDAYEGWSETDGPRLFSETGEPEAPVGSALSIANSYKTAAVRTDAFAATLQKLGLFQSISLDAKLADGETTIVHGLLIVDEQLLAKLPDADFLGLRKAGYLKPIYAHLASLGAVSKLADKLAAVTSSA